MIVFVLLLLIHADCFVLKWLYYTNILRCCIKNDSKTVKTIIYFMQFFIFLHSYFVVKYEADMFYDEMMTC